MPNKEPTERTSQLGTQWKYDQNQRRMVKTEFLKARLN